MTEDELVAGFVGRGWVLERVAGWLASGSRMLVVTGAAGSGKSAVAARLLGLAQRAGAGDGRGSDYEGEGMSAVLSVSWLAGSHVCVAGSDESRNPVRFVELVSGQLAQSVPGFAEARDAAVAARAGSSLSINAVANAGPVSGWNVGALVQLGGASAAELADVLLRLPLRALGDVTQVCPPQYGNTWGRWQHKLGKADGRPTAR